ncbi:MAG: HD-GYP domain-containing protein [Anaerolineae bacterium]
MSVASRSVVMSSRSIPVVGTRSNLDRMRWVSVLGTTMLVAAWEILRQALVLPQREWVIPAATVGLALLLANVVSIVMGGLIRALQGKVRQRTEELATINALAAAVSQSLNLDTVLDEALSKVLEVLDLDAALIFLSREDGRQGEVVLQGHHAHAGSMALTPAQIEVARRIGQRAMERRRAVIETISAREFAGVPSSKKGGKEMVPSFTTLPLVSKGKTVGALCAVTQRRESLNREQIALMGAICDQIAVAVENGRLHGDLKLLLLDSIRALADAVEARDAYTGGHCESIADHAVAIGEELGLTDEELEHLQYGALLHDIGKIGVDDAILGSPGPLSRSEYAQMKAHATMGARIVDEIAMLKDVVPIIEHHHERYDGLGYPKGLVGEEIPLVARILSVADSFGAMTTDRPYRKAMGSDEAFQELQRSSGSQFDPRVVDAFLKVMKNTDEEEAKGDAEPAPEEAPEGATA